MNNTLVYFFGFPIDSTLLSGIIAVVGTFIGMVFGGVITYCLNIKQQKKALIRDLQIKVADDMIKEINKLSQSVFNAFLIISDFTFNLEQYNDRLSYIRNNPQIPQPHNTDEKIKVVQIEDSFVKMYADNMNRDIEKQMEKWIIYSEDFNSFYNCFESKQVILNKFVNIYQYILRESRVLLNSKTNFIDIYYMEISSIVMRREFVSKDIIEKAKSLSQKYEFQSLDFGIYLQDFKVELQNYFFSDLFKNYRIPRRNPKDKKEIVLTIDIKIDESL